MIYTSGTTGSPKGALLSHDNLVYASDLVSDHWNLPMGRGSMFSFLPLCHIAEKLQNVGVGISRRYLVTFCSKFENVSTELPEAQPTLLLCVPRLWEKLMEGVISKGPRPCGRTARARPSS
jgi:long-chain acyl-CoA synthetase